jgi:hypothetical protein
MRESAVKTDDDIHCTFAPKKDPRALKAMKSGKCGYDFVNREDKTGENDLLFLWYCIITYFRSC